MQGKGQIPHLFHPEQEIHKINLGNLGGREGV